MSYFEPTFAYSVLLEGRRPGHLCRTLMEIFFLPCLPVARTKAIALVAAYLPGQVCNMR